MTVQQIVNYVLHTPLNTNKNILIQMLNQLVEETEKDFSDLEEIFGQEIILDCGQAPLSEL